MSEEKNKTPTYYYLILDRGNPDNCDAFGPFRDEDEARNSVEHIREEHNVDNDTVFVLTQAKARVIAKFEWTEEMWTEAEFNGEGDDEEPTVAEE